MNAFHNESAIRCELCNYPLENQEKYEAHMKKHEEDPNYRKSKFKRTIKCDVCKRCFNTDEEFKKHICKHFTCEVCDESFLHRRNLEVHRSSHEGKEVFSCDICEALFNKRYDLNIKKNFFLFHGGDHHFSSCVENSGLCKYYSKF